ncbi:unnamed protein product, partial [Iphiclides podalirius]
MKSTRGTCKVKWNGIPQAEKSALHAPRIGAGRGVVADDTAAGRWGRGKNVSTRRRLWSTHAMRIPRLGGEMARFRC